MDTKSSNPKDLLATNKLPVDLVPDTAIAYMALAFTEGALKYGRYNWRIKGVRWSVYEAALQRHRMKVNAGEWSDPVTGIPHLASMMACLAIILDAKACGKLIDDRPPANRELPDIIDGMAGHVAHLKKIFAGHDPHQYTIKDGDPYVSRAGKPDDQSDTYSPVAESTPREDVQSISRGDGGRMVLRPSIGPLAGVQVESVDPIKEYKGDGRTYTLAPSGELVERTSRGGS